MLYHYNSLLQGSRDAVRYVAGEAWNATLGRVDLTSDPQLVTRTKNIALYGAPTVQLDNKVVSDPSLVVVQVSAVGTEHVQVELTYSFQPLIGNGIPGFIGGGTVLSIPLVATTVMRAL